MQAYPEIYAQQFKNVKKFSFACGFPYISSILDEFGSWYLHVLLTRPKISMQTT